MSRGQRFTFLAIALVIAVAAIVVLADTSEDETEPTQSAATATPEATQEASPDAEETPTATPTPRPQPPLLTAGRVRELEYTEGDTIRFRVRSDAPEEIHVHCYDITRDVPAGRTIGVSFEADITGICEVEFHNSGESIAELRVEPG